MVIKVIFMIIWYLVEEALKIGLNQCNSWSDFFIRCFEDRCRIESCDASDSNAVYEPEWWSVRMLSNDLEKGCLAYMADWNGTDCLRSSNDTTLTKCDSWVYDQSEFQATTFTDVNTLI